MNKLVKSDGQHGDYFIEKEGFLRWRIGRVGLNGPYYIGSPFLTRKTAIRKLKELMFPGETREYFKKSS